MTVAVLIHANQAGSGPDEVTYDFVLPPDASIESVVIPVADPNAFRLAVGTHRTAAARVVARAVRVQRQDGSWPQSFTVAS